LGRIALWFEQVAAGQLNRNLACTTMTVTTITHLHRRITTGARIPAIAITSLASVPTAMPDLISVH